MVSRPWRRRRGWIAVLGLCLGLAGSPFRAGAQGEAARASAGPAKADSWYAASVARGGSSFLLTHYWSKGRRLRTETVAGGRRLITIVDDTTYYVIDPTREDAIAIARSPLSIAADQHRNRPFADELDALRRAGGEFVESEKIATREVARYQLTNDAGRVQVWIDPELELPVRVERYIRSSGEREQLDYTNWMMNVPIADSFFEPPQGMKIERMSYEDYVTRSLDERVGPAPPFYSHLLHGDPEP